MKAVVTVAVDTTVRDAITRLTRGGFAALPVDIGGEFADDAERSALVHTGSGVTHVELCPTKAIQAWND
jgi:CBS domain-containing protein